MANGLDEKYRIAVDLLEKGATEVEITDAQLIVRRRSVSSEDGSAQSPQTNVSINVASIATASIISNVRAEIGLMRNNLLQKRPKLTKEINKQFDDVEHELSKNTPSKRTLRRFLKWAADLDWKTYAKLAKMIIEAVGITG